MRLFGRFRRRVLAHGLAVMILMAGTVLAADRLFVNPGEVMARVARGDGVTMVGNRIIRGVFLAGEFRGVVVRRLPPPLEPYPGPPVPLVLLSLAICVGVTLLASMPLSRAIVRPVEALAGSRDRRTGGVGLGMAIVRTIVEAHGGNVVLESSPGHGTRVTMRLPGRRSPPDCG
jgi:hypothetical protein